MPDPITARIVRRIFKLYVGDRLGTIAVAQQLRAEQSPAPSAGWGHPAVHRILTNPTYRGRIRWRDQDFQSTHEPLIDHDTFEHAQAILAERGSDASRRRGNRSDFLLSGVIRCGHCGRAYIGMSAHGKGGTYHYYACTARQKYGPKACNGERIPREKLETAVLRQLTGIYRDGPLIQDALAAAHQQAQCEQPALDERRRAIAAEITRTERSTERYFEAFEQGRLSPERCEQRVARLNARLDDLRAQQAELADDSAEATRVPTAADLAATAGRLERVIADGEPEQTKALLRILIAELRINGRHDIQPTYRVITPDRIATAGVCATYEKVETAGIEPALHSPRPRGLNALAALDSSFCLGEIRLEPRAASGPCIAAACRVSQSPSRPAIRFRDSRLERVFIRLVRGEPLAGWNQDWTESDVAHLRSTHIDLLQRSGHVRLATGDAHGAIKAARQGLTLDGYNEDLWRLAMQADGRLGQRGSVSRRYEQLQQLRRLLEGQLGLEPESATRTLSYELLGQR